MPKRNEFEELTFKAQGLTEAIGLLSRYEDLLQGLVDRPGDPRLRSEFDNLGESTAGLQNRFEPYLSLMSLFSAQMASLSARMEEEDMSPTGAELGAVTTTLANLESELRVTHSQLESFEKWVNARNDDLMIEIADLSASLLNIQRIFEFSNSLKFHSAEAEIFRDTVIKLLSSAIEELKAPAVNVSRLKKISHLLRRVAKRSVERKLGEGIDQALDEAIGQTRKVTDIAEKLPGLDALF